MYRKSKGYWNFWQYVIFGRLRSYFEVLFSGIVNNKLSPSRLTSKGIVKKRKQYLEGN